LRSGIRDRGHAFSLDWDSKAAVLGLKLRQSRILWSSQCQHPALTRRISAAAPVPPGLLLFLGTPSRLPHAQVGDWVSHSVVSSDRSFGVCCAAGGLLMRALQDTTLIGFVILTVICVLVTFVAFRS
jgi:hypothetical protein